MAPVKVAYSTNAYTLWPLERAIDDIRDAGFDGVEILADDPHAFPPGDPDAIRARLRGFPISNLNGNTVRGKFEPSLIHPDSHARRERIGYTKAVLDLARALGSETVCTSSGFLTPGVSSSQAREWFLDSLERILAYAERSPAVRVGIECEPGFFVDRMEPLSRILEELDHPLLGLNLDLGHAVCVGDSFEDILEMFSRHIWNIHVEDIEGRVHHHLIPGHGSIRFDRFRAALDRHRYDRFLTLEIYPYKENPGEAGREGLAFLRKILGR